MKNKIKYKEMIKNKDLMKVIGNTQKLLDDLNKELWADEE